MNDDTLILILIIWGVSAIAAGAIASDRSRGFVGFAVVTFFFLGPLGPGFALLATHGDIERAKLHEIWADQAAARDEEPDANG